jgi:hypothetical protein
MPSLISRFLTHTSCRLVSDSDMYLASVDDNATVFCAQEFHAKIPPASFTK